MLSMLAVFAFSVIAASAAQAEFPVWITKETGNVLKTGETRKITSKKALTAPFELKTASVPIECQSESSNNGEIIGGKPGTDKVTILFDECSLKGKKVTECSATSVGESTVGNIKLTVKTVLVFDGWTEQRTKADDAFFPEGRPKEGEKAAEPNLFVEVKFANGTVGTAKCGTLNGATVKVNATGTEVKEVGGKAFGPRKCGVLAEVGKIVAGPPEKFERTVSGEVITKGGLNFPGTLKKAELEAKATGYAKIECELKAGTEPAEEIGTALVETEPAEAFGWEA